MKLSAWCMVLVVTAGGAAVAADKTPVPAAAPPPPTVLYENSFEQDDALKGWLSLGGTWALATDETSVVRQTQPSFRGVARLVRLPVNYEVSATVRPGAFSGQWGVGLVGYWQPGEGCYRFSNFGSVLALWRESATGAEALAAVRMELKAQPYRMKLNLQSEDKATALRAKVWAVGEREPDNWLVVAQDFDRPLRYGRPGVFTGRASAVFSDFTVTPNAAAPPAEGSAPAGLTPGNYWHFVGGDWQSTATGLRQSAAGSTLGFRAAAYALAAGWTEHTIQVAAKADSGSRNQGFGLSACYMEDGQQYQFGQTGGTTLFLSRRAPDTDVRQLASSPLAFRKGLWYLLKLQLTSEKTGVRLRGKAWPARAGEPKQWQIETLDDNAPRLSGGEIGLWCIDDVCSFDDLQVTQP
ncbi:hypothetical protein LLH23_08015 [bacterium]|nr:hypothetical protein [bacterium]